MQSVFIIIIGEDWNTVMYDHIRNNSNIFSLYFVALLVFGNFILLSLFTAILLQNFESNEEDECDDIDNLE